MHRFEITITQEYLDSFGHVNNAAYLVLFEKARWNLITQNGYGIETIQKTQLGPVILEVHAKFIKELKLNDHIVIETVLDSYKNKIGTLSQKIIRDNEVCCEATFAFGLFDLTRRKLILPTKKWLKAVTFTG